MPHWTNTSIIFTSFLNLISFVTVISTSQSRMWICAGKILGWLLILFFDCISPTAPSVLSSISIVCLESIACECRCLLRWWRQKLCGNPSLCQYLCTDWAKGSGRDRLSQCLFITLLNLQLCVSLLKNWKIGLENHKNYEILHHLFRDFPQNFLLSDDTLYLVC